MKTFPLGQVAQINPRGERILADQDVSFVGMAELDAGTALAIPRETRASADVSKGFTIFRDGDVLAAKITPCWENGKVGQARLDHPVGVGSTEFHVVRPSADTDDRYLLHFLRLPTVRRLGTLRMTGSAGQRRVPAAFLSDLQIPLPSMDEQRRIAAILDHADALRRKRRQVITHLDALTQSIFHDMFGDPDAAIETVQFGAVAGLSGGRNLVADDASAASTYRVLKISAVTSGEFKPGESKPLPNEYEPPLAHFVRTGDLLMSRANTAELVGAVAYVHLAPPNLVLPDKVWRFDWRDEASVPVFYHSLLQTKAVRRRISQLASGTGGSMKNVSQAKLETMRLPLVPPDRQQRFAAIIADVVAQRELVTRALGRDDELFASLQSRAFKGEL